MDKQLRISDLQQIRVLAAPLRLRILGEMHKPRTVKQIAVALDLSPAKVHYHVKELARVGLIRLVATKEKSGILEKYYQPVAEEIFIDREALAGRGTEQDQAMEGLGGTLRSAFHEVLANLKKPPGSPATRGIFLSLSDAQLTRKEAEKLHDQLGETIKARSRSANDRPSPGAKHYTIITIVYPGNLGVGGNNHGTDDSRDE